MFFELDYAKHFKNFATGGLVSLSNTKNIPPCVMYVVPLTHIIHHVKNNNIKMDSKTNEDINDLYELTSLIDKDKYFSFIEDTSTTIYELVG